MKVDKKVDFSSRKFLFKTLETLETPFSRFLQPILLGVNFYACIHFVIGVCLTEGSHNPIYEALEVFIFSWFVVEYLCRLYAHEKRLRYIFSFYGIIDLLSIVPHFLDTNSMTFLRALRTLRILRFLRYLENEEFFFGTITKTGLQVIKILYTLVTLIFISSAAIYECERLSSGGAISSYFDSVYFTVITLTTVGYGDITPLTDAGKMVTIFMILGGVIFIPWQAGKLIKIILVLADEKREVNCNHCGLTRHDLDAVHCKMCGYEIYQEYDGV